jgi:hypothetical protein
VSRLPTRRLGSARSWCSRRRAVEQSRDTLAVLSSALLRSNFAELESILGEHLWLQQSQRRLVIVRRESCRPRLRIRAWLLSDMTDDNQSRASSLEPPGKMGRSLMMGMVLPGRSDLNRPDHGVIPGEPGAVQISHAAPLRDLPSIQVFTEDVLHHCGQAGAGRAMAISASHGCVRRLQPAASHRGDGGDDVLGSSGTR